MKSYSESICHPGFFSFVGIERLGGECTLLCDDVIDAATAPVRARLQ